MPSLGASRGGGMSPILGVIARCARSPSAWAAGLVLLGLGVAIYPLWAGPGPVNTRGGGDSPFLYVRLEQLVAALRAGAFPARWMSDTAYGLGYPFFNFYAALPYYIAAGFRLLGCGPIYSIQVTQALGFALAAATMALLARRAFDRPAAVALAVVAYTCAPFHLVNVYVRGDSLSEFYAFVFYPLIFWSLLQLRERPRISVVAWLGLGLGGLALTHNLSAIVFSPFAALYALYVSLLPRHGARPKPLLRASPGAGVGPLRAWWRRVNRRALCYALGGGVLGVAISAALWLPAVADLNDVWMGIKDIQVSDFFNYSAHFRQLGGAPERALIQPRLFFDYRVTEGSTPFAMALTQAALTLAGAVAWIARRARRRRFDLFGFAVGGFALATWMILPASRFLWDHLPVLPIVQFPWRFLSAQAFFGSLLIGALAEHMPRAWWTAVGCAALLALSALVGLRPEYLPIAEGDITPERLSLFESFTTNIGTTIRGEYLPASVEPRPLASAITLDRAHAPPPMVVAGDVARTEQVGRDARRQRWRIEVSSTEAQLAFHTFYFPGWKAYRRVVSGWDALDVAPLPNSGLITLRLPRGEHDVLLRFERTPVRRVADMASLLGLLVTLPLLIWGCQPDRRALRLAVGVAAALIALLLIGRGLAASSVVPRRDDLSMDFDRMPLLHHNPKGIRFGEAVLRTYAYPDVVRGGETLSVALSWAQLGNDLEVDLRLVSPADAHPDLAPPPPPLARTVDRISSARSEHSLTVPTDAARGPYYLALRVRDRDREIAPTNARGEALGTTYLRPVWIENPRPARPQDAIAARFGERILLRDDVRVDTDETGWTVRLTWQATAAIPRNYTCSLHLLSSDGSSLAQRDFGEGPGYGFWPTTAWPVGEWLTDRLRVPAPEGVRVQDMAALLVVLYDRSQPGYPAVGKAVIPLQERARRYDVPEMAYPVGALYGGDVRLLGYDLDQDGRTLRVTLHWQAVRRPSVDGIVFVHLFDPASKEIVAQSDLRPLRGTYPLTWWREGEVVSDEVILDAAQAASGNYCLAIGILDADSGDRLPVVTAVGQRPDRRLILETQVVLD